MVNPDDYRQCRQNLTVKSEIEKKRETKEVYQVIKSVVEERRGKKKKRQGKT
jgi:hypothetical protein